MSGSVVDATNAPGGSPTLTARVLLATALRPELGISGIDNGLPVVDSRHPDAVETTTMELASSDGQLIVTCSTDDYPEIRRIVSHAQIRSPQTQIAIETLPGTPLAVGVISSLVDEMSGKSVEDQTAQLFAAFDFLRQHAWSAAWLPSVTRLRTPSPSLWQHARSWLPGSGFLAVYGSKGFVKSLTRAPVTCVTPLIDFALITSLSTAPDWVVPAVVDAMQPRSTSEVTAIRDAVDAFGSSRAVEFVAIPADFHDLSLPDPATVATCNACGARHSRSVCPFCKMTLATPPLGADL